MDLELKGKRFIVTGGTRGIGAAIVKAFLDEGAKVAFCSRNAEDVNNKVQEWGQGGTIYGHQCDVRDPAELARFSEDAIRELGGLDGYIANVSGGSGQGEDAWKTSFDVDLMATVRGCDLVLPHLAEARGSIVVITSIAATEIMGGPGPYGAIKAALISYASQLGDVAGRYGIRVNSLSPGPIFAEDGFWGEASIQQPETVNAVKAQHPGGRLGTPEEVASIAVFLSSNRASWINRANILVDGGFGRRIQF